MLIKSFEDCLKQTNISTFLRASSLEKGSNYITKDITLNEDEILNYRDGSKSYVFRVYSSENNMYYNTSIWVYNDIVKRVFCDCSDYFQTHTCEHIAAVFINEYNILFNYSKLSDIKLFSKQILKNLSDLKARKNMIKKEAYISLEIELHSSYRYYYGYSKTVMPKLLIGDNKMYVLGSHINAFEKVYKTKKGVVKFGNNFIYDPDKYYFSNESIKLIDAYIKLVNGKPNRYFYADELKNFFSDIRDSEFVIDKYQIDGIKENFPIESCLIKKDNEYELKFNLDNIIKILDDFEYIIYQGKMYHLDSIAKDLLTSLANNNYDHLEFDEEDVEIFTKGLLHEIKDNIIIDEKINQIVLPTSNRCELYFDISLSKIIASIKIFYDDAKIDYFDNGTTILRNSNYENHILNDLLQYGFQIEGNKIILKDLTLQVEFLEHGLEELTNLYPVFTSEKIKNINITKKTNISSSFSIGKDNILNFDFDLGGIDSNELLSIFDNIREKKKYYRLKSGDILSLDNEDLIELANISNDLELTDEEIIAGKGSILKYRALYLDSIKNHKYNIIKTDSLFDNFIDNFYKYKNAQLTISDLSSLRDYQVVGVKWLYNLAKTGFGGILADEMGLGKTIQIIYYIKQMLIDNSNNKFLIVTPTSLAYNWEHEFNTFAPEISKIVVVGTKDKRHNILNNIDNYNVLITTYGILREDEELYQDFEFNTIVIDEAQNIKNHHAGVTKSVKKIKALNHFALTGTPLENSVLELWSIFDFIMPGYLSSLTKFQAKYRIKDYDSATEALIKGLSHQINPFMLRRKKEDVLSDLPEKMVNDIYIDLSQEQKEVYAAEAIKVKNNMQDIIKNEGVGKARFLMLELLIKLRQICIDPRIVYEDYKGNSNKIDTLLDIVSEYLENNHKILIFSSFRTGLNIVKEELTKKNINTYVIDGSTPADKRLEMVDSFNQNDDVKVFLIMLKAGGTGLNLIGADTVIHLDLWWNPQAENQATDRAHRIGQTKNVEVIHLISRGTIEEKILELQNKKRILSDKLIDSEARDTNILNNLSEKDILELISYENKD